MADRLTRDKKDSTVIEAKKARTATFFSFLICGMAVSAWAPMVPLAKERIGLNEAELGLILLAMGAGAIVTMPFIGPVIQKRGSRMIMLVCSIITAMMLPLLAIVESAVILAVCLFVFGAGIGCLDVAMNSQAVVVQDRMNRHIMSSFHGMFSVGGLIGAMVFGALLYVGLSPFWAALSIALLLIVLAVAYNKNLLGHAAQQQEGGFAFRLPKGPVILLGIFCFIAFLAEGALLDWSALFLREDRGFSVSMAGVGYSVFSISMSLMRFYGDNLVQTYGPQKIVFWGAVLASAGLVISTAVPLPVAAVTGFFLIGVGAANIVPVLFSAAGKADPTSPELALAAVTTLGYAGQLAGPALIGFVAHATTLPVALGLLAAPLMFIALAFSSRRSVASAGA